MQPKKKNILIVDDSELNRLLLSDILFEDYNIIEAENGMQAMAILHEHGVDISLMLLDIVMPEMDGFEVLAAMNKNGWIETIPVIMISAESGGAYIDHAYDLGAIDYINRPFDERTVKHRVASNFMMSIKQKEMQEMLSDQIYQKEKDNNLMIEILSHIVEFRNGESGLHVLHVRTITERLLKELAKKSDKYPLTPARIKLIATASALHDIGKISVPSEILNKPGRFTPEEFEIMKRHTVEGGEMLKTIPIEGENDLIQVSYAICRWHHERYDGRGYPDKLVGDEIPIEAQVVSVADVYDALTSKRCYKDSLPPEKAIQMICNGECGAFNPELLECLLAISGELEDTLKMASYGEMTQADINDTIQQLFSNSEGSDVTRRMVKQLEHERLKFKHLSDISHEIMFECVFSPEMVKLSDWSAESLDLPSTIVNPRENAAWCAVFPKKYFEDFVDALKNTNPTHDVVSKQMELDTGTGKKWYKVIGKALWVGEENPELDGAICKIIDVDEETTTMKKLERRAERDPMTGLYNKAAARKHITQFLNAETKNKYALMFVDIDDFKHINDNFGHAFGDKVIQEVAYRILNNIRSSDIAARMGGDEFLIFLEFTDEYADEIEMLTERIYNGVSGPVDSCNVSISMGVACVNGTPFDYDLLLSMADVAMYSVKKSSKQAYGFYDDSMKGLLKSATSKDKKGDKK